MADALTIAIEELKAELNKPDTIHKAVQQYIIAQIVEKLIKFDQGGADDDHPAMALSVKVSNATDTADDEGTATHCQDSDYTAFGLTIWTSHTCESFSATGETTLQAQFGS